MTQTLFPLLFNLMVLLLAISVTWHLLDWTVRNIKKIFRYGRLQ